MFHRILKIGIVDVLVCLIINMTVASPPTVSAVEEELVEVVVHIKDLIVLKDTDDFFGWKKYSDPFVVIGVTGAEKETTWDDTEPQSDVPPKGERLPNGKEATGKATDLISRKLYFKNKELIGGMNVRLQVRIFDDDGINGPSPDGLGEDTLLFRGGGEDALEFGNGDEKTLTDSYWEGASITLHVTFVKNCTGNEQTGIDSERHLVENPDGSFHGTLNLDVAETNIPTSLSVTEIIPSDLNFENPNPIPTLSYMYIDGYRYIVAEWTFAGDEIKDRQIEYDLAKSAHYGTYYLSGYSTTNIGKSSHRGDFDVEFKAWPMFRHDPRHSGFSTSLAPDTNQTLWTYTTGGQMWSSPSVADNIVVIGSDDANVYTLNETTGGLIWNYATGAGVKSSAAIENGIVFIGSEDSNIYALNATTGALVWNYATGSIILFSSPAVSDGMVYIGSHDGNVYALNATTGVLVWNYPTGLAIDSSPAVAYGMVYIRSWDGYLYALHATDGTLIWKREIGIGFSSPAVADGRVYVASGYNVLALNATTGTPIWSYTIGADIISSPAVAYGTVFIGSRNGNMYALNATTGAFIWNYATGGPADSSPAVADSKVFFGSGDKNVYALNATTGASIWSYTTSSEVFSSPAIADGRVYIGSENKVYAFSSLHDVAVIDVMPSKTVVGQGFNLCINMTVGNTGDYIETFNVIVYRNTTAIELKEITLASGIFKTITFTWNTTGIAKGSYTISARATPVPGETDWEDNTFVYGIVRVVKAGDFGTIVGGYYDFDDKCDYQDLFLFRKAYVGPYQPLCDFDNDQDVDYRDLFQFRKCYINPDP